MRTRARILVIEDEPRLGELLRLYLVRDGHDVRVIADGREALRTIHALDDLDAGDEARMDLIVLDLMLPGVSGETLLDAIREHGDIPVLIASAKRSDLERIAGLRMGADDYLAKPFNPHELTARVAAILRRSQGSSPVGGSAGRRVGAGGRSDPDAEVSGATLSIGGGRLVVDLDSRRFVVDGSSGRLTPGEAGLLLALARRPGTVHTRDQLLEAVTRRPDEVVDRVVDVHVANLRRKLGDDAGTPWLIETIPQTGYRLVAVPDPR